METYRAPEEWTRLHLEATLSSVVSNRLNFSIAFLGLILWASIVHQAVFGVYMDILCQPIACTWTDRASSKKEKVYNGRSEERRPRTPLWWDTRCSTSKGPSVTNNVCILYQQFLMEPFIQRSTQILVISCLFLGALIIWDTGTHFIHI